jgi:hypothetical protein
MSHIAFIRRPNHCDILIRAHDGYMNNYSAWEFCQKWLRTTSSVLGEPYPPEALDTFQERVSQNRHALWDTLTVGSTRYGTAMIYNTSHHDFPLEPYSATSEVNPRGTVSLTPDETFQLGPEGEPSWFIPFESEGIWHPERRTAAEMDRELDRYASVRRELETCRCPACLENRGEEEHDLLRWPTDDEEPCTFGMQRGICRCCGELTVEPDIE